MAEILTVNRSAIDPAYLPESGVVALSQFSALGMNEEVYTWLNRPDAEKDPSHKQLIPYCIVEYNGRIGCYRRSGDEKRLHDLYSIGIGGHIDREDDAGTLSKTIEAGMFRELSEEFTDFDPAAAAISFAGVINDDSNEVGSVHLGLVFSIKTSKELSPAAELSGFEWVEKGELAKRSLESWSALALGII